MLRCTCCHRWTVEQITLNDRPRLKVQFAGGNPRYLASIEQVRAEIGEEAFRNLEPEPDDGCE